MYINNNAENDMVDKMLAFFHDDKGYLKFKKEIQEKPFSGTFDIVIKCGFVL